MKATDWKLRAEAAKYGIRARIHSRGYRQWSLEGGPLPVPWCYFPGTSRLMIPGMIGAVTIRPVGPVEFVALAVAGEIPVRRTVAGELGADERRRKKDALWKIRPHCCRWCSRPLEKHDATIDHVVPRSRNGSNAIENLVLACDYCNNRRADRVIR